MSKTDFDFSRLHQCCAYDDDDDEKDDIDDDEDDDDEKKCGHVLVYLILVIYWLGVERNRKTNSPVISISY